MLGLLSSRYEQLLSVLGGSLRDPVDTPKDIPEFLINSSGEKYLLYSPTDRTTQVWRELDTAVRSELVQELTEPDVRDQEGRRPGGTEQLGNLGPPTCSTLPLVMLQLGRDCIAKVAE
jgi:hypothetical protein